MASRPRRVLARVRTVTRLSSRCARGSYARARRARRLARRVGAHFTIALHFPDTYTLRARTDPVGASTLPPAGFGRTRLSARDVGDGLLVVERRRPHQARRLTLPEPLAGRPGSSPRRASAVAVGRHSTIRSHGPPTDAGRRARDAMTDLWTRPAGKGLAGPCERSRPPVAAPCRPAGTAASHESTEGAIAAAPLVRPSRRTPRDGGRRDDHPFREGVRLRS
jgi:hypothetical protein